MAEFDFLAKIIIIGECRVGKTSMWHQYCDTVFYPINNCTIGVEFKVKKIDVDGKKGKLQIWDTAGEERFMAVSRYYYRGSMGVLLCYAINNRESFEKIEYWLEDARKNATEKDICIVLVGTKSDLHNERVVSIDEGRQLAESLGIKFFETSAKNNLNISETFLTIGRDISEVLGKEKSFAILKLIPSLGKTAIIRNLGKRFYLGVKTQDMLKNFYQNIFGWLYD